jgi:uroporphyrinogen-III decarboxylase
MTDRERLLAIMAGRSPDRIPWIPRLEIWYQAQLRRRTMPEQYRGWSLRDIERDLGLGTPARGGRVFRTEVQDVELRREERGYEIRTEYATPVGTVSTLTRRSDVLEQGGIVGGREIEHMIKGPDDYAVVEYIIQHTEIIPTFDEYLAYEDEIGEDGVPLVSIGADPFYRFMRELVGYNAAFYHLMDYPNRVAQLLEVLTEHCLQIQQIVLESPAVLILHGEHFDSQMTSPPIFRDYMLPYFQPFAEKLHARGKTFVCHADADASMLLELIVEAGYDMAECFVTAPMVPLTLEQARKAWGTKVSIWGGIPSVLLCDPVTDREFEDYMMNLFRVIAPGDAFILGVADNVMAEGKLERVQRVTEMVQEYGTYPVQADR